MQGKYNKNIAHRGEKSVDNIHETLTDSWQSLRMKSLLDLDRVFNLFLKSS